MSLQCHPNLHAVNFACEIAHIIYQQKRPPTLDEMLQIYTVSLRGGAHPESIDIEKHLIRFCGDIEDMMRAKETDAIKEYLVSFIALLSQTLDDAVRCG